MVVVRCTQAGVLTQGLVLAQLDQRLVAQLIAQRQVLAQLLAQRLVLTSVELLAQRLVLVSAQLLA